MEELGLMERFADPELFSALSYAEKLEGSLITTLMGMGTTFLILTLLWGIIAIMARLMKTKPRQIRETAAVPAPAVISDTDTGAGKAAAEAQGDSQLIAVIMGAIAAAEGTENVNHLIIRKISRISGNRPAWGNAGTADSIESRKF